ncbi:MAG: hypothetical protein HY537_15640 [Deltaproteobacteria bacterium]|nr:hypothetical protein [Deltaproteobacteria bacterium]
MSKRNNQSDWKSLKHCIESQDNRSLVALIKELFELSTDNSDFIRARYADVEDALKRYKSIVSDAIYPDFMNDRRARIDFATARRALSDFKRACDDPEKVLDLMIHYVEIGTRQANDICVDYESYYTSLESMFSSIIRMLAGKEKKYGTQYLPRLRQIARKASDGYGYQDTLREMLEDMTVNGGRA